MVSKETNEMLFIREKYMLSLLELFVKLLLTYSLPLLHLPYLVSWYVKYLSHLVTVFLSPSMKSAGNSCYQKLPNAK